MQRLNIYSWFFLFLVSNFFILNTGEILANIYYVSPIGNDNDSGTYTQPWTTWQKGFNKAVAGDTVYIRGGVYYTGGVNDGGSYFGVIAQKKNGTAEKMINIWAYQDEIPIMDCSNMIQDAFKAGIYLNKCNFWYLRGLHVRNLKQNESGNHTPGMYFRDVNHCKFELLKSYSNGWVGIELQRVTESMVTDNLFLNCDAFDNYDPYTDPPGGDADGLQICDVVNKDDINTFIGCRAWGNADDGYDFWRNEGVVVLDSCWAFLNGSDKGDGNGFKLGRTDSVSNAIPHRIMRNCIAYGNRRYGFDENGAKVAMVIYNNISYKNGGRGYYFYLDNAPLVLRNNISFGNTQPDLFNSNVTHDHNSWNDAVFVTDDDFVSIHPFGLDLGRQADGSLPNIDFLKLETESDLIDAGTYVGLPFVGEAPDLGPFENQ